MKQQAFKTITMLSLIVMFAATSSYAQAKGRLQAKIPFDFTVHGKTLPADTYVLERIDRQTSQEIVLIRSAEGRASMMVRMRPAQTKLLQEHAKLVFNRYGERYFLSQMVTASDDLLELPKSRNERALERKAAGSNEKKNFTGRLNVELKVPR